MVLGWFSNIPQSKRSIFQCPSGGKDYTGECLLGVSYGYNIRIGSYDVLALYPGADYGPRKLDKQCPHLILVLDLNSSSLTRNFESSGESYRHNSGTNCLFADGHVSWHPEAEIQSWAYDSKYRLPE
ncbi:hypothetical protein KAW08_01815 [bacterium]|nr:hypothetical protein [bacterium]